MRGEQHRETFQLRHSKNNVHFYKSDRTAKSLMILLWQTFYCHRILLTNLVFREEVIAQARVLSNKSNRIEIE